MDKYPYVLSYPATLKQATKFRNADLLVRDVRTFRLEIEG